MVLSAAAMAVLLLSPLATRGQDPGRPLPFGGTYDSLKKEQQHLVDKWVVEYNRVMSSDLTPQDLYNGLSISVRTTFEAVTHALMTTELTEASGGPLGRALDLIEAVEAVRGKVPGVRGDQQFRLYAILQPDAVQRLEQSREFERRGDNTVYHAGYPQNFRQGGRVPSMQFSISPEGRRVDIDVDYRSWGFPQGLFSGHLTASNSDVRAGDNYQRHINRWSGFANWWKRMFGVPVEIGSLKEEEASVIVPRIPSISRAGRKEIHEAAQDFLHAWLVEKEPLTAAAYFSRRAYACVELYGNSTERQTGPEMAPFVLVKGMTKISEQVGEIKDLAGAVRGVVLQEPALRRLRANQPAPFTLYSVPDDIATEFECSGRLAPVTQVKRKHGSYFGTVFRLRTAAGEGQTVGLLWTKEDKQWKIASWEIARDEDTSERTLDLRTPAAPGELRRAEYQADPAFVRASAQFMKEWLVERRYDSAIRFFSPQSYDCLKSSAGEGGQHTDSSVAAAEAIREGLGKLADQAGKANKLATMIQKVEPVHPDTLPIRHPDQQAYALNAIPDYIGEQLSCADLRAGKLSLPPGSLREKSYGKYYVAAFQLAYRGSAPAALSLLWAKVNDAWRIVAFRVETP